jgi:hypothetical protein
VRTLTSMCIERLLLVLAVSNTLWLISNSSTKSRILCLSVSIKAS